MWIFHPECDPTYFKLSTEGITSAAVKSIHSAPHVQAGVLCQNASVMEASCWVQLLKRTQDLHGVLCLNDNHFITPPHSHQFSSHLPLLLPPRWTDTLILLSTPSVDSSIFFIFQLPTVPSPRLHQPPQSAPSPRCCQFDQGGMWWKYLENSCWPNRRCLAAVSPLHGTALPK